MKKIIPIALICGLLAMTNILSSCGTREDGDWIFSVKVDPSTSTDLSMNFDFFANPIIIESMKADANRFVEGSQTYVFSGEKSEVLKNAKAAFQKAINAVESKDDYNQVVILGGIKVNLLRTNRDTNVEEVVDTRTLKE